MPGRFIEPHDQGLILRIAGRQRLTYVPSAPNESYDPAKAWSRWLDTLRSHQLQGEIRPAFFQCSFSKVRARQMTESGLNYLVQHRVEQAGLSGRFVWTSLRTGMIRTAIRDGKRAHLVAAHVGLSSLTSVQRHEHRERLLDDTNVAGRLGL